MMYHQRTVQKNINVIKMSFIITYIYYRKSYSKYSKKKKKYKRNRNL